MAARLLLRGPALAAEARPTASLRPGRTADILPVRPGPERAGGSRAPSHLPGQTGPSPAESVFGFAKTPAETAPLPARAAPTSLQPVCRSCTRPACLSLNQKEPGLGENYVFKDVIRILLQSDRGVQIGEPAFFPPLFGCLQVIALDGQPDCEGRSDGVIPLAGFRTSRAMRDDILDDLLRPRRRRPGPGARGPAKSGHPGSRDTKMTGQPGNHDPGSRWLLPASCVRTRSRQVRYRQMPVSG